MLDTWIVTGQVRSVEDSNVTPESFSFRADSLAERESVWDFYLHGKHVRAIPKPTLAWMETRLEKEKRSALTN